MQESGTLDILKQAILLEKKGNAFYQQVADHTKEAEVRDFFQMMADEEKRHIQILSGQFKNFHADGKLSPFDSEGSSDVPAVVLSDKIKDKIAAATFEAAAISAAMSMEKAAIQLYSGRAKSAEDREEKALYAWLAKWEENHLEFLAGLDGELKERVWNASSFWPF
jgi:rubrerythrin